MKERVRLGILFGGRSGEHEVSVSSARSLIEAIDSDKFEVVPIGITKSGSWLMGADPKALPHSTVTTSIPETVELLADVSRHRLVPVSGGAVDTTSKAVDVIFPLLHGPFGEDGTVQGMLELAGVPYIGAGVAASAVGMDKAIMKALFEHAGLAVARYQVFTMRDWVRSANQIVSRVEQDLGFPVFVKPCRLGSSVGISKARTVDELWSGITEALAHDRKIIVEEAIYGREVECGLLGNDEVSVSVFGEVLSSHDFYDYSAKYTEGVSRLVIPAGLTSGQVRDLTTIAIQAFEAIDCAGMARVDFFIESDTERIVLNEINTIPGFAPTSMFPKLWEASGLSYGALVERLIELALERFNEARP